MLACALALAFALAALALAPAPALAAERSVDTVVVVLTPFLTWDDITPGSTPELWELAQRGSIGDMNSITTDYRWPAAAGGALTLSAGRWAATDRKVPQLPSSISAFRRANEGSLNPPEFGALGSALRAAGLSADVIGCGNEDTSAPSGVRAPAALVAMDASGRAGSANVGEGLLAPDPAAPFGVRADREAVGSAIRATLEQRPALLVIDTGDLERAHDATLPPGEYAAAHAAAVRATSETLGDVLTAVKGRRVLLMVVTPATDKPYYQPPYFGPTIVAGPGFSANGGLTSGSTHRPGLVTNLDFGPTVCAALGVAPPRTMIGLPMTSRPGRGELGAHIEQLPERGAFVGAVDYARDLLFLKPFTWFAEYVVLFACFAALVPVVRRAVAEGRGGLTAAAKVTSPGAIEVAGQFLTLALCVPGAAWLLFAMDRYPLTSTRVLIDFGAAAIVLWALVTALPSTLHSRREVPLLALSTLTALLILADQWTLRPFESGLFSYSIRAGWRYYGLGNEGAALLVGASVFAVALACDVAADSRFARPLRRYLMPSVGAVCLVTAAAPFLGANAGVAIWGVAAYGIAWARLNGVHFGWKTIAAIIVVVALLVIALAAVDMAAGRGETHIGRFFTQLASGDATAVRDLVVRKALNNWNYLPQTPYTLLCLTILVGAAVLRWVGDRPLAITLRERSGVSAAVWALLIGGIVATISEDSGVVMPALMLFAGLLPVFALTLWDAKDRLA